MRKPANTDITLAFGATTAPYNPSNPHKGTDFAYTPDDTIYAPFSGKVSQVPNNGNDGNGTYMTDSQGRYHGLLHASKYLVPNGAFVQEGQPIAVMGESGYTQGKHLHWAVKYAGKFIDPMSLVTNEGGNMDNSPPVTDGDVINWKRFQLNDPKYQPTGAEFDFYKERGWKRLAEDARTWMQNHPPAPTGFKKYDGQQLFIEEK